MAQSLFENYVHIVFSTKNRIPFITPEVSDMLHAYLAGICSRLECYPIEVGGHVDHVHILCKLSKKIPATKFMEELKSSSSRWMKEKFRNKGEFYWQRGYGVFSVAYTQLETVKNYIRNQAEHHKKEPFTIEYPGLLRAAGIEFDERYLWT